MHAKHNILLALLVALTYVAFGILGAFIVGPFYAGSLFWLPEGIVLGAVLLYGRRSALAAVPGGLLLGLWLGLDLVPALGVGLASATGVLAGSFAARGAWRHRVTLHSLNDVISLWRVSLITAIVTAVLMTLNALAAGILTGPALIYTGEFILADLLGIVLVTPVILAFLDRSERPARSGSTLELTAILAYLVVGSTLMYAVDLPGSFGQAMVFLLGPALLLLVLRFGWRETAIALLLMAPVAFAGTNHGVGPFTGRDIAESRAALQMAFIGAALMAHVIVALMVERRNIIRELEASRDDLELRVARRTAELKDANMELAAQVQDRERAETQLREHRASLERVVSERTAALEEANRQLTSAMRAKSQFLANMSHELRTPLNSIIGFTDVLSLGMAGDLTGEQLHQIRMVNTSGRHLLDLVNDILDITKIEAGAVKLSSEVVALEPVVGQVIESMRPLAAEKGLAISLDVSADLTVCTDRTKLQQILINLIGNAIKFTPTGSVHVRAERVAGAVTLCVSDTGIGIPEDEQPAIFEEFHQARSVERGKPVGTGLGLPISRRLARMLGGELTVSSEVGAGSVFSLSLPKTCIEDPGEGLVEASSR